MIEISKIAFEALRDTDGNVSIKPVEWWRKNQWNGGEEISWHVFGAYCVCRQRLRLQY